MQTRCRLMLFLSLGLPGLLVAQAVTPANIVGTWYAVEFETPGDGDSIGPKREYFLTLSPDSTWSTRLLVDGAEPVWKLGPDKGNLGWSPQSNQWVYEKPRGRWWLVADTLQFDREVSYCKAAKYRQEVECLLGRYQVARQGPHLVMGRFADRYTPWDNPCPVLFTPIDSTKAPPVVAVPTLTLNRADLIGIWTSPKSWFHGTGISRDGLDTLTLRNDSTWSHTKVGDSTKTGTWALEPGDRIHFKMWRNLPGQGRVLNSITKGSKIELQDKKFFLYNGERCEAAKEFRTSGGSAWSWKYERVSP